MSIFSILGCIPRFIALVIVLVIGLGMLVFFGGILLLLLAIPILFILAL